MRLIKEKDITKTLKQMAKAETDEAVFQRVWFKLEDRIAAREKPHRQVIWKPWGHPAGWVAAACLFLAFTGALYHRTVSLDNEDMVRYMMSVSNSTSSANVTGDLGLVNVSVLLSGPSVSNAELMKADDDHSDILAGDEIFL